MGAVGAVTAALAVRFEIGSWSTDAAPFKLTIITAKAPIIMDAMPSLSLQSLLSACVPNALFALNRPPSQSYLTCYILTYNCGMMQILDNASLNGGKSVIEII